MIATQPPIKNPMPAHIALNISNDDMLADEKVTGCLTTLSMPEVEGFDPEMTLQSYGRDCLLPSLPFTPVEFLNKATGCFSADAIEDDSFTAKLDTLLLENMQEG